MNESDDLRIEILERLRERVSKEDGEAILEAIMTAATLHLPMPPWLASAVVGAIAKFQNWEVRTLDEAFGISRPKGKRQDAPRREGKHALSVIAEIVRLHYREGMPLDGGTFEAAGKPFGIGKTLAGEWFYKHQRERSNIYLVALQMVGVKSG